MVVSTGAFDGNPERLIKQFIPTGGSPARSSDRAVLRQVVETLAHEMLTCESTQPGGGRRMSAPTSVAAAWANPRSR